MADYKPHEIEPKWQAYWEENKTFRTPDEVDASRPKFYVLDMFPYPSGAGLHVGHPEGYTATDIIARVKRMRGFNVLHPMGWDAFGLPAERAAVRENAHPAELTKRFIDNFRKQIKRLGFSYDWDREFSTTDEAYYKWTQWIVLKLYDTWYDAAQDRGRPIADLSVPADVKAQGETAVRAFVDGQRLAYQAEVPVNWCPAQGTVLSNEEVQDGKYVETGDPVYRRNMRQWLLRIPRYAERLSRDLADLDWPEPIKEMQRNWIGRSEGAEVDFVVASERSAGGSPAGPPTQQPRTRQPSKPTSTAARKRTRTKVAQPDSPDAAIKGWYARRGVPHFDGGRVPQHVTFRLVDSFPSAKLTQWKRELADLPDEERNDEIRERTEEYLDAGHGESWLKDPRVAEIVQTNLLHFHGERYELHAWAIMPNHVHVLATPADGHSLPDIVHAWKSFTSKAANKVLGRTGSFWQREYFDRYVRDRAQYETVVAYIEHNPVKARLCKGEADWKWSSAGARVEGRGAEAGKGPAGGPPALHRTSSAAARVEGRGAEAGEGPAGGPPALHRTIRVFTTRPDTLFGATYMVLSPEHALVREITTDAQRDAVDAYVEAASRKSDLERTDLAKEKTGVFTGAYAINPVNDARIPIWIADYVLATYGTGAIMAVPGQDERDWEFAKVYDLPIIRTVQPPDGWDETTPYVGEGPAINSDFLNGLSVADAKAKMIAHLEERGLGVRKVNYKLRDWLFSRQRYWGEPFPLIHVVDDEGNIIETKPVPVDDLPVTLPDMRRFQPTDDGDPPLARAEDWVNTTDPETGKPARRETNTMPQWAGSCWYYLRYIDPQNAGALVDPAKEKYWMPVDLYVGGAEHAVLHLLYARFWHKVLFDCGVVSTKEPFQQLFNQGLILAYSYKDDNGKYYSPDKVEKREVDGQMRCVVRDTDIELHEQIEKMSKSRYNVTNPDDVIDEFGADSLRLYEMYMGPLDKVKPWRTEDITGMYRFLGRAYRLLTDPASDEPKLSPKVVDAPPSGELLRLQHATVKRVTEQVDEFGFNVAIAALIELVNAMYKVSSTGVSPVPPTGATGKATEAESSSSQDSRAPQRGHGQDAHATGLPRETVDVFLRLLAPFAPHLGEELWAVLGHEDSVAYADWPTFDESLLVVDSIEIPVQVNGKLRSKITLSTADAADRAKLEATAKDDADVQRHLDGRQIVKVIAVPNKLVNLVVK